MGGVGGGHTHIEINNPLPTYTQLPTYPSTKTPLPHTIPTYAQVPSQFPYAERRVGSGRNKRETGVTG